MNLFWNNMYSMLVDGLMTNAIVIFPINQTVELMIVLL